MPAAVVSLVPFPAVDWWMYAVVADELFLDGWEHFQKMSRRNRYRIAAANGPGLLSVPLAGSRNQRSVMKEVLIDNRDQWQIRHWRTLFSAYRRAPFFAHFEPELEQIFNKPFERLCDFNRESIDWLRRHLGVQTPFQATEVYEKEPAGKTDARDEVLRGSAEEIAPFLPRYRQVFEDRYGFTPGLSALDLLFSEGPAAGVLIRQAAKAWAAQR